MPVLEIWWHKVQLLGMEPLAVAWIAFVAAYVGRDHWITPRRLVLWGLVPAITIILGWSNELHHLLWQSLTLIHVAPAIIQQRVAPWYWIDSLYAYAVALVGMVLLATTFWRQPGIYRRQTAILAVAALVPISVDIVFVLTMGSKTTVNLAPLAFTSVLVAIAISFLRFRLFNLVPSARDFTISNMADPLLLVDRAGRITDINPAAELLLGTTSGWAEGKGAAEVCSGIPALQALCASVEQASAEIPIGEGPDASFYDVLISPLLTQRGEFQARLLVLRDITERKRAEQALRAARDELEGRVKEQTAELRAVNLELEDKLKELRSLRDRLREQAIHDPLTGLYNRRFLTESLRREIARARRAAEPVAFLMFDIDHFKRVNDRYSHSAGDAALKMVSEALSAGCRPVDIVCRYSGEEFLMVMPGGGPDDAHARAEEFRTRIERMGIQFGGTEFSITTSIGVSVFPLHGATGRKAIAAADRALYVAKESGRNLTVIAE